ncbi:MAG TPA: riboflavin synthase [Solirubrobacteraceae bacterium]|nr:riboflavin synthase [Solirubrobacteraceae bacterium]
MFTGLIADLGAVAEVEQNDAGATLTIRTRLARELQEGDSIAVNGVCLTVRGPPIGETLRAQAMLETLSRSSLGGLRAGAHVNLELPLRAEDRLGGHVVQGHVDGTGTVSATRGEGFARVLEIDADPGLQRYLVEKGSVAVDGVSLTVSALHEGGFAVSLIPETLERTNLGTVGEGSLVNIEVDVLAKHVERLMDAYPERSTAAGGRS